MLSRSESKGTGSLPLQHNQFELGLFLQELRRSLAALNTARQGIQERDFLIATHERSEQALAQHANSLCSDMDGAAQEMTALFDR